MMISAVGYTKVVRAGQARAMDFQMMDAPYIGGLENLSKKERRTRMIEEDYKCSTMRTLACIVKFYWQKKKN